MSSDDTIKHALEKIELDMNNQIKKFEKNNKLLEAQRIKQRTMFDLEMLRELGVCSGIENYSDILMEENLVKHHIR